MINSNEKHVSYEGYIVNEDKEIESLVDGNIYITCKNDVNFCNAMTTATQNLFRMIDRDQLLYDYNLCVINNPSEIFPEGKMRLHIETGVNVIIPLKTINSNGKNYMVAEMEEENIDFYLPNMILETERISKKELEDAFMNLAISSPKECNNILSSFIDGSPKSKKDNPQSTIIRSFFIPCTCYCLASVTGNITQGISYQDSVCIFKRFVSNCQILKYLSKRRKLTKDSQLKMETAKQEIDFVFNTIWGVNKNANGFRTFFLGQSDKKLKELYDTMLDRDKIAKDSKLYISIEKSIDGIDKRRKNDGIYRVFLRNDNNKVSLHFGHSEACVIYMMYLIDIYKHGKDVDTLSIKNNKDLFCKLYSYVYGENSDASTKFDNLFKPHLQGDKRKVRLTDCHTDIRKALEEKIKDFDENSSPFIISNENSHLAVMKEKVSIPNGWENLEFSY